MITGMEIRERIFGPCAAQDVVTGAVTVDVPTVLLNLLLFESYVIDSHGMKEVPRLLEVFDYGRLMELLKTGALRFKLFRALPGNLVSDGAGTTFSLVIDENTTTESVGTFARCQ
jgi:hypothetical protein